MAPRSWRPVAWAAGAGFAGWVLGNAVAPTILTASAADAVDLNTIRDDLISVVQMAMEPADLSTWTTHHD
jgi:hypothetical protein